jgi:hypothetical protein
LRPCVVGIGGAGGKVLKQFLRSQDVGPDINPFREYLAFGDAKGIWLDSAKQDAQGDQFYGSLIQNCYPGYLICHDIVENNSKTREYANEEYGIDLKAQGYDRRAEYMKWMFEIFEYDKTLKDIASGEFNGEGNPIPAYIWKQGIRPFTTLSGGKGAVKSFKSGPPPASATKYAIESSTTKTGLHKLLSAASSFKNTNGAGKPDVSLNSHLCDSILFIASLGGGTGTGFINPITSYVRKEENTYPIFALGILTEKGKDERFAEQGQRYLGAVIAMYDLLTKGEDAGIDMLILIDNQILVERTNKNYPLMDKTIYDAMKPLLDLRNYPGKGLQDDAPALRRMAWHVKGNKNHSANCETTNDNGYKTQFPSVFVPCYHSQKASSDDNLLIEAALEKDGQLFHCTPSKAEMAYVFSRGFMNPQTLSDAVHEKTGIPEGNIFVYPKLGDGRTEDALILLRNPYGGDPEAYKQEGTFEKKIYDITVDAIKYIDENEDNIIHSKMQNYSLKTKGYLKSYFYDEEHGIKKELERSLDRLKAGQKPIFTKALNIFNCLDGSRSEIIASEIVKDKTGTDKEEIRKLVKNELEQLLESDQIRAKIKEVVN